MARTGGFGTELRIQVRDEAADLAGGGGPWPQRPTATTKQEKRLHYFVRTVAFGEWVGNAFGTLAFLWGTVVLLGGFCSSLDSDNFWIITIMIFIEAFRMFSRNYRLVDQSLFMTTRAITRIRLHLERMSGRLQERNELVATMGLFGIVLIQTFWYLPFQFYDVANKVMLVLIIFMGKLPIPGGPNLMSWLRRHRRLFLWGILIALLLQVAIRRLILTHLTPIIEVVLPLQVVTVLLLNLRPQRIANLTNRPLGRKLLCWAKVILAICLVIHLVSPLNDSAYFWGFLAMSLSLVVISLSSLQTHQMNSPCAYWFDIVLHICFLGELVSSISEIGSAITFSAMLVVLLAGNLQIPSAATRIVLSSLLLSELGGEHPDNENLVPSIVVFYALSISQGALYIMACVLELFTFFFCRSLLRCSGLSGQWGARAVDLYYQRACATCMETDVFVARNTMSMSLASFAIDSLSCSSPEMQYAAVRVLHSLLQQGDCSEELISRVTGSRKAMSALIPMLGWTTQRDRDVRLFAARVTTELAGSLKIFWVPGMVKSVSSLLEPECKAANQVSLQADASENAGGDADTIQSELIGTLAHAQQMAGENEIEDNTGNVAANEPLGRESTTQPVVTGHEGNEFTQQTDNQSAQGEGNAGWKWNSWVWKRWQHIKERWSIPKELSSTHQQQDSLPVLGMLILERLASDLENCQEIVGSVNLISKTIGLISYTDTDTSNNDDELRKAVIFSSLSFVRRLAGTAGRTGVSLRQALWDSPFLLSNLACVLEDSRSGPELWEPAIDTIAKLSFDVDARKEIGSNQVVIAKLMHAFIGCVEPDNNLYYDQPLRLAAGEALSNLAIGNASNCLAILDLQELGYEVAKDLIDMLRDDEYRCCAASLLQSLCVHSRDEIRRTISSQLLSSALAEVMVTIMAAEGKQLEVLVGFAAQVCMVSPESFVFYLESHLGALAFVQKLVGALHCNMNPSPEYPRMRRVITEMTISLVESTPSYATIFKEQGMMEALSKVGRTPSRVEKYRVFSGDAGVVLEDGIPLPDLVATAKGLIGSAAPTSSSQDWYMS